MAGSITGLVVGFLLGKGGNGETSDERASEGGASSLISVATLDPGAIPETRTRGYDHSDEVLASMEDESSRTNRLRTMIDFVDNLEINEVHQTLNKILSPGAGKRPDELIRALYERWVGTDPRAAIAHAESRRGDDWELAMGYALDAWISKDSDATISWLRERPDLIRRPSIPYRVVNGLAKSDPEAALKLLMNDPMFEGSSARAFPGFIYTAWAEKDPAEAADRVRQIDSPDQRKNAMTQIGETWISQNPDAALAWASGLEEGPEKLAVFDSILPILTALDIDRATRFLDELPQGKLRGKTIYRLARSLANEDPAKAYEFLQSRIESSSDAENAYRPILGKWAFQDPERAFEVALTELDTGASRSNILEYIIESAVTRDLDLAIEMVSRLDGGATVATANRVAEAVARRDVDEALNWVSSLPRGQVRDGAMQRIINEWASQEPEAAAVYAMELSGKTGQQALGIALIRWGSADASSASAWAIDNTEPERQMEVLPRILYAWGHQDQAAAKEWLLSLPEGEIRRKTIADSDFVSHWAKRDPNGIGEWLNKIEHGPSRDAAVEKFVPTILATDPDAAITWVESINDEEVHLRTLESLARNYLNLFPDRDRSWITNSALPEEKKAKLIGSP